MVPKVAAGEAWVEGGIVLLLCHDRPALDKLLDQVQAVVPLVINHLHQSHHITVLQLLHYVHLFENLLVRNPHASTPQLVLVDFLLRMRDTVTVRLFPPCLPPCLPARGKQAVGTHLEGIQLACSILTQQDLAIGSFAKLPQDGVLVDVLQASVVIVAVAEH